MGESEVIVLCYWNGCIKYGPEGLYYEGSTPKKVSVKRNTEFSRLLDGLYLITGLDKQKSKLCIVGRYPVAVSPHLFRYVHLPVVNDTSLETLLEVPSNHPSINTVELYLHVKPASGDVIDPPACSSPLGNPGSSSKRQKRTQQPHEGTNYVDTNVTSPVVKIERDNELEVQANADFGNGETHGDGEMIDKSSGSDGVAAHRVNLIGNKGNAHKDLNVPGLEASASACLNKGVDSSTSNPWSLSSLWVDDDHELRVGLCFKDRDELKKAVDWYSIKRQQKCLLRETEKDKYTFECIRWKCKWSLWAARMEEHGFVEITKCSGPHTCCPKVFESEFVANEIEGVVRVQPTVSVAELKMWWIEKFGCEIEPHEMKKAKLKVITRVSRDEDHGFRVIPKLMSALHSSNGLAVDWQYDVFPNPEFASFNGVFWAFSQSIEGFQHCRPLIVVDTRKLHSEYQLNLMIASGVDAANKYIPLAFAVTKEVTTDSWRWFLTGIREKVTQRKDLCLISSPHPDILAVINEPGSRLKEPWAHHRFCLNHLCFQFLDVFEDDNLELLVMKAGYSCQKEKFDSYMNDIKEENPEARRWLDQIPPHQWALAHDGGRRYGVMEIKPDALFAVCRGFSFSRLALSGFMVLMFDELRDAFHESFTCSRDYLDRGGVYTKPVMDKLEEFVAGSVTYAITPLDRDAFHVAEPSKNKKWIVQLNDSFCTCGEFQADKFPCLHALAVCDKLQINPLRYVDDCYTLERYHKTYAAKFHPVPELSDWPEASGVPTLFAPIIVPPPPKVSGKGKDKTKETPSDEELRDAIVDVLKVADFNTAEGFFIRDNILTQLAEKFGIDLTPRKSSIKVMIQYELDKYADKTDDVDDDDDDDDDDDEEDEDEGEDDEDE